MQTEETRNKLNCMLIVFQFTLEYKADFYFNLLDSGRNLRTYSERHTCGESVSPTISTEPPAQSCATNSTLADQG